jgi:hypothetical protein
MRELHDKASMEIEKQDKVRKRRMAITEASRINPDELNQKSSGSILEVKHDASIKE